MLSFSRKELRVAACLVFAISFSGKLSAGELRKYAFEESRNYGWNGWGTGSAVVSGTFEVDLDFDTGLGTLVSLDAHLSEFEGIVHATEFFSQGDEGGFFDEYRPPTQGILEAPDFRPTDWDVNYGLGFILEFILAEQTGEPGFLSLLPEGSMGPALSNSWVFYSHNGIQQANGWNYSSTILIYFDGHEALFSLKVPVIDATPYISFARATLVPEPTSLVLLSAAMIWTFAFRGCCSPKRISP